MNLSEINFKDPSKIPNPIKATIMGAVFIGVLVAGIFLDTDKQHKAIVLLEKKEADLRLAFLDKKKQAVNLSAHKKQLVEIEEAFGTLLRQLPNKSEMDALLNDINQAGVGRGLSFDLFKPAAKENTTEFYAELPVSIAVSGTFTQFGFFSEDVSRLSRIVTLDNITLKPGQKKNIKDKISAPENILIITAVARTYRYLDPKEIEAKSKNKKSLKKSAGNPGIKK